MGNWGNTLDRWYHRAAVVVWPREQAFANRAETSPAWALDELAAIASAGDVPGAQAAAATLAPFWDGALRGRTAEGRGRVSGLFGQALRAAELVADAETAAMLLRPFRIENLTDAYVNPFGRIADRYGQPWTAELLRAWSGGDQPAWAYGGGQERPQWVADRLPGLCKGCTPRAAPARYPRSGSLTWRGSGPPGRSVPGSRRPRPAAATRSSPAWANRSPRCCRPPPRSGRPARGTRYLDLSGSRGTR